MVCLAGSFYQNSSNKGIVDQARSSVSQLQGNAMSISAKTQSNVDFRRVSEMHSSVPWVTKVSLLCGEATLPT